MSCTYEYTMFVTAHTKSVHTQDRSNLGIDRGFGHRIPPLAEELLPIYILKMLSLISSSGSRTYGQHKLDIIGENKFTPS